MSNSPYVLQDFFFEQYNQQSEDDGDPGSSNRTLGKRGTRACDRCRRVKSKCEEDVGNKCKNCNIANTPCTYQSPNFKRGPPKGYIHSIEQRWHQVECILATIMVSPRSQDIMNDLRSDPFARSILDRVQAGPYGTGRSSPVPTAQSFYASLIDVPEHTPLREDRRYRRQSRVSREIVSLEDGSALRTPTREWQDQLSRQLTGSHVAFAGQSFSGYQSDVVSPASQSSSSPGPAEEAGRSRRRLDSPYMSHTAADQQNRNNMYTISDDSRSFMDPVKDASDSFGHLSLDENQEIRYHGSASGLPLLARSDRKDDIQKSNGIWNFDVANVNAEFEHVDPSNEEGNQDIQLPHPQVQIHLLELYFTYIHPMYPVIHKQDFLANYDAMTNSSRSSVSLGKSSSSVEREPIQKPCKLLLLSMFAIAARYSDQDYSQDTSHGFSKAGQEYVSSARILLNNNYQCSRPSTCQALLLLAVREFGVGSMQQGWLYTGMALRMAIDLGMNRDADRWMDGANELFSPVEKQIRKHIWWSCCTADKLSAIWLGRPITFRANDYSTTFLDAEEADEYQNWHPYPHNALGRDFSPVPGRIISCWREACSLSVIITDIMDKIYPVKSFSETPRRTHFEQLETRLHQWLINLQDHLRYCTTSKQITPLPHILTLHIEYCAAVLLLHRAFLPPWNEQSVVHVDPFPLKAFDVCQNAASHISSMATIYDDTYGLDRSPPFMSIFLQSAGIMHVITLTRRPWNAQATVGLRQCITSLKHMERTWPSTMHIRMLLEGAKVQLDQTTASTSTVEHRPKRSADDALGDAKNSDILEQQTFEQPAVDEYQQTAAASAWDYSANARIVAQTLGIDVPGFESSTSFYPGYQWWPHTGATKGLLRSGLSTTMDMSPASAGMDADPMPGSSMPQQAFTFDQHQLSQEFVEGVNHPLLDFSRFQSDQDHHS